MSVLAERLKEPFTETTRKVRNHLMAAGTIGVLVADVGIIPSKISALGIEFTNIEQSNLLKLLLAIMIYYIVTFSIYSLSELSSSKLSESENNFENIGEKIKTRGLINFLDSEIGEKHDFQNTKSSLLRVFRSLYEIAVPLVWGLYSAYALYKVL
ncbi:hypothetical protein HGG82_11580 [Marinomonas sp. M1K-6]|uniref:Uncharacterized protein n=1 Tax=Marinomonas profundi TaxID=2726122 RepID=A0A847RDH8_9GAMM|nr:hypothetical protein [Marinomonas profundi]NLQ18260.1 hypothetical protein [Marinomonas profundi]UDV03610.1 hypothetical protein J8N69_02140 [Marinomonas profundi]